MRQSREHVTGSAAHRHSLGVAFEVRSLTAPADRRDGKCLMTIDELPPTLSVVRAGEILGMSRTAAYRAVNRGEIPTIRLAGRHRVPTLKLLPMLGYADDALPLPDLVAN